MDEKSPKVNVTNSAPQKTSSASAEACVFALGATTDIPLSGASVIINGSGFTSDSSNRFTIDTNGVATYTGIEPVDIIMDANIFLEPTSSSKSLGASFYTATPAQTTVTFTNGTNLVNETATALINNDSITFLDNGGTLPTGLRGDIMYHVINKNTNDFQLSYTVGGSAVTFSDNGSGTNQYKNSKRLGSIPKNDISANGPRGLVPQALQEIVNNEKIVLTVTNLQDSVNIEVTDVYYRLVQ